ncbi:MAG: DUF1552 domain-containing protein [Myxococcaceae bacterium]|nr:DUF1552 domain-containing protein [Myxococcaceae bacterium]
MNRRELLKSLGSAAAALPVLPSLMSGRAAAQAATPPLRFVFLMNRNGQMERNFYPAMGGAQVQPEVYAARLADVGGNISPIFHTPFDGLKSKLSILRGLDIVASSADHCRTTFLCGSRPGAATGTEGDPPRFGASIDWLIERSAAFYAQAPRLRAIRFSINPGRGFSFSNVNGTPTSLPYIATDQGLFNNVFQGFTGGGPVTVDPAARRSAVIDASLQRFALLQQHKRLGGLDKQRLQQHADHLTTLKSGLQTTAPAMCTPPSGMQFWANGQALRRKYENVNDIIVSAFTCDITRIASVYLEDFDDTNTDYSYFHGISHADEASDAGARAQSLTANRWIADRVAHLINKLDSTLDVNGRPMLENTIVVWGNEISNYWHRTESLPTMVAGGGSRIQLGAYLDYRQRPFKHYAGRGDFPAVGRPYTQFLCSLMRIAGLQSGEFEPMGQNGKFGEFTLGTYDQGEYTKFASTRTDNLPAFTL